ncbi:MAG: DUF3344 domain-containing protein [Methanospirillum sp.]|nr:DUF3344 domain-containing protein [Methanospirillum sp.]
MKSDSSCRGLLLLAALLLLVPAVAADYTGTSLAVAGSGTVTGSVLVEHGTSRYSGEVGPGGTYTVTFPVTAPSDATVRTAWVYLFWTWSHDGTEGVAPSIRAKAGGATLSPIRTYTDRKGSQPYDYPAGTIVYSAAGHARPGKPLAFTVTNAASSAGISFSGAVLLLAFDGGSTGTRYWVAEGADMIYATGGVTADAATTRVVFSDVPAPGAGTTADLVSVVPGGNKGRNTLSFNGKAFPGLFSGKPYADLAIATTAVGPHLVAGKNTVAIRDEGDYMVPGLVVLRVAGTAAPSTTTPRVTATPSSTATGPTPTPSATPTMTTAQPNATQETTTMTTTPQTTTFTPAPTGSGPGLTFTPAVTILPSVTSTATTEPLPTSADQTVVLPSTTAQTGGTTTAGDYASTPVEIVPAPSDPAAATPDPGTTIDPAAGENATVVLNATAGNLTPVPGATVENVTVENVTAGETEPVTVRTTEPYNDLPTEPTEEPTTVTFLPTAEPPAATAAPATLDPAAGDPVVMAAREGPAGGPGQEPTAETNASALPGEQGYRPAELGGAVADSDPVGSLLATEGALPGLGVVVFGLLAGGGILAFSMLAGAGVVSYLSRTGEERGKKQASRAPTRPHNLEGPNRAGDVREVRR